MENNYIIVPNLSFHLPECANRTFVEWTAEIKAISFTDLQDFKRLVMFQFTFTHQAVASLLLLFNVFSTRTVC